MNIINNVYECVIQIALFVHAVIMFVANAHIYMFISSTILGRFFFSSLNSNVYSLLYCILYYYIVINHNTKIMLYLYTL